MIPSISCGSMGALLAQRDQRGRPTIHQVRAICCAECDASLSAAAAAEGIAGPRVLRRAKDWLLAASENGIKHQTRGRWAKRVGGQQRETDRPSPHPPRPRYDSCTISPAGPLGGTLHGQEIQLGGYSDHYLRRMGVAEVTVFSKRGQRRLRLFRRRSTPLPMPACGGRDRPAASCHASRYRLASPYDPGCTTFVQPGSRASKRRYAVGASSRRKWRDTRNDGAAFPA